MTSSGGKVIQAVALGILLWNELTFVPLGTCLSTGEGLCEVPHVSGLLWAQGWLYNLSPNSQLFQGAVSTSDQSNPWKNM